MDKVKNKILVISYDFFPDNSPNTYRWLNVLRKWNERGVEIHVLSFHKNNFTEYEEFEGIIIYRIGKSAFEKLKSKIFNVSEKENYIPNIQNQNIDKKGFIRKIYNLTWKKLYFPDFAFLWQSAALKKASEIIKKENITDLITVSWPFSDHVVGSRLKKKFVNINWIADTIDPFYLSKAVNNNFLYNSLNYNYEKKVLSSADVVTVLTDKLKHKYSKLYPSIKDKISVNHNIFVPYDRIQAADKENNGKTKLVFVGTLTPITRSPLNLLQLFDNLFNLNNNIFDLELHFYGDHKQCADIFEKYNYLLEQSIFLHGLVPREQIPTILDSASILINIGNNNEFQEPSKILEYIYFGKPILNVCSIEKDSSLEVLSKYDLNYNVFVNDIDDKQKEIELLSFLSNKHNITDEQINNILCDYLLPEVEKRYFKLLI